MAGTGNSGRRPAKEEREALRNVIAILKGDYEITNKPSGYNTLAKKVYAGESDRLLGDLLKKMVPDLIEQNGVVDFNINIVQYGGDDTPQLPAKSVPAAISTGDGQWVHTSSDSMAQEEWEG